MKKLLLLLFTTFAFAQWQNVNATTCAGATAASMTPSTALVCGTVNDMTSANTTTCGNGSYKGGLESVLSYTPATNGSLTIAYSGQTYTGIFLYAGCPTSGGTCVGNITSTSSSKSLTVNVTGSTLYYIVFDTWPTPASPCAGTYTLTLAPPAYCIPAPSSVDAQGITNVTIGTINNTTVAEAGNYGNYTAQIADVAQSTNVSLSVTQSYTNYNVFAWVDWNNDLDFLDAGEAYYIGNLNAGVAGVISIAVPGTASLGNHRLRIGGADTGLGTTTPSNPCYNGSYGSFEDYTLNVTVAPSCLPVTPSAVTALTASSVNVNFICATCTGSYIVEYSTTSGFTAGTTAAAGSGTVVTGGGLSIALSGLSANTTYYYRVRQDCGSSSFSTNSSQQSFTTARNVACGTASNISGACYSNNTIIDWLFASSTGDALKITVNAGQVENIYDEFEVYDGANASATLLYSGYGTAGNLAGLTFNSTGSQMYIRITPDGSTDCTTDSYTNLDFDIVCLTCAGPAVTFTTVPDCANNQYSVNVNVTSMGSATSYDIDIAGTSQGTVSGVGTTTVGPYTSGTVNNFTLIHNSDNVCDYSQNGVTYSCPPANDECSAAIALTVNPDFNCGTVTAGTTTAATASSQLDDVSGTPNNDVWYTFVATGANHRISLTNLVYVSGGTFSSTDMGIGVYNATSGCSSLVLVGSSDPETYNVSGLTAGTTYAVRVYAWSSTIFNINFNICVGTPPPPPANDDCSGAITLTQAATCTLTSGTTIAATQSIASCLGSGTQDVWYKFVATATQADFNIAGTPGYFDAVTQVFNGGTCGALGASLICEDDEVFSLPGLTIGNTYFVRINSYFSATASNFTICITTPPPPPVNDNCSGAVVLTQYPNGTCTPTSATTFGATSSMAACLGSGNRDVWFQFVATSASAEVNIVGSGFFDAVVEGFTGAACGSLSSIGCIEDVAISLTGLTVGTTYTLRVNEYYAGDQTNFTICVTTPPPPPANDDLCNATVLVVDAAPTTGTNAYSTAQVGEPSGSCYVNGTMNTVWFSFVATASALKISTDFIGVGMTDDQAALYAAPSNCANLATLGAALACGQDEGVVGSSWNMVMLPTGLTVGNTYYVQLDGYFDNVGDYKIQVTTLPPAGTFVWTGATNSTWTTTTNWAGGVAPSTCANNVFIQSSGFTPTISTNATVGNIETQAGATVNINAANTLTVCGDMVLKTGTAFNGSVVLNGANINVTGDATIAKLTSTAAATMNTGTLNIGQALILNNSFTNAGTVVLKSTNTSTAYLDDFTNGAASYVGNIKVERYVTTGSGLGQRFFGSAVASSAVTGLDATYASGYPMGQLQPDVCGTSLLYTSPYSNLFSWNQAATLLGGCQFSGWTAIPGLSTLTPARGYSGWMNDASVLSVTGAPNTGNVTYVVSATNTSGNALVDGWHLVSNPYPSPLNVNGFISAGFTSPTIYNGASGPYYGTFLPALLSGNVASMQGLYVEKTGASTTMTVTNANRVASSSVAWKSSSTLFDEMLTIDVLGNGFADKTYVYFSNDNSVTNNFDDYADSKKRNSNEGQPTIYSGLNTDRMALNGFPMSSIGQSIPLGVDHGANGNFTLAFDGLTNFAANTTIYLEDKQAGVYHNIANGNYAYTAMVTDNSDRFMLHFVLPIELATVNANCEGKMGAIELVSTEGLSDRTYEIVNATSSVAAGKLETLNAQVAAGVYNVKVSDAFGGFQMYTVEVGQDETIVADYSVSSLEVQVGEVVLFNNLTANATNVEWNIANLATINGVNNATYSFNTVGAYDVVMNVSNADCSDSKSFTVNVSNKTTSVTTLGADNLVKVYSDKNVVTIAFDNTLNSNASVAIQNVLGQKVFNGTVNAKGVQNINLGDVTTGYYFVSITLEGKSFTSKVYIAQK